MAIQFPIGPAVGDTFNLPGSTKTYYWTGSAWLITSAQTTATSIRAEIAIITSTTNAVSTDTGALVIAGGVGIGKDLYVGGILYTNGVPAITTASFNISDGPDGGVDINIQQYFSTLTGTSTIFINNISTLESVTGRGATTPEVIRITNTAESTATGQGALIIAGGLSVAKRINSESLKIADTVFDSTRTAVNSTAAWVVDTYLLSQFRSAKYLLQVAEPDTLFRVHSQEMNVIAKDNGNPYKTEYGEVSSNGPLGDFDVNSEAIGSDFLIKITFTPFDSNLKIVRVLRTAMTAT